MKDRPLELSFIDPIVKMALEEDLGAGDVTTDSIVDPERSGFLSFQAEESLVTAGLPVVERVFQILEPATDFQWDFKEGDRLEKGAFLGKVSGKLASLLKGERTALNFLQRLSGIATLTAAFKERMKNTKAVLLDTRKTTPCLRVLEKYAVRIGGGKNHRMGLFDGILIKENHIIASDSLENAVRRIRNRLGKAAPIEIEVESLDELKRALESGVDIILLDNFKPDQLKKAVKITSGRAKLEASGGVNLDNIGEIARTGVDFISCGALTQQVTSANISCDIES